MQDSFILKENESRHQQTYNVLGMDVYLKVAGSDTGGQLSMFAATYKKNQGPPLHLHNVDELFYISAGTFLLQAGENRYTATTGDTVFVPRNMPHAFLTLSDTASMLFVVSPTDNVEILFSRLNAYPFPPAVEEVVRLHEELGLKIVGPPIQI